MKNHEEEAIEFAKNNNIKVKINKISFGKHFLDDKENRYIFNITLFRNKKRYTFNYGHYGQSLMNRDKKPGMYDILSCLEKYEFSSFEDFCSELGYDEDSRRAYSIYLDVCRESEAVNRLFGDIIEELREIM